MARLGRAYRDGRGVEKDIDKAISWMHKAAKINFKWERELNDLLQKYGDSKDL